MLNFCHVFCPFRNVIRFVLLLEVRSSQPTGCICSLLALRRSRPRHAVFSNQRTLVTHKRSEWPRPSCVYWELSSHPVFRTKVREGLSSVGDLSPAPDLSLKLMKYNMVKPPSSGHPRGTGKRSLNGGWPLNRGLSWISINLSRKITRNSSSSLSTGTGQSW